MKTSIFLFHPKFENSRGNKALIEAVRSNPEIEIRDMYCLYPDMKIDILAERRKMEETDRIVFQFPMYWYSSPALLKEWQDLVFTRGWSHGSQGKKLQDKELLLAVTLGAQAEDYSPDGKAKYRPTELLRPFQATARLVGMKYLKPFIAAGIYSASDEDLKKQAENYLHYLSQQDIEVLADYD